MSDTPTPPAPEPVNEAPDLTSIQHEALDYLHQIADGSAGNPFTATPMSGAAHLGEWLANKTHKARIIDMQVDASCALTHGLPGMVPVAILPDGSGGVTITSMRKLIESYRTGPAYREGVATMDDVASLVDHANRFKTPDSVIFVDKTITAPGVVIIYDYNEKTMVHDEPDVDDAASAEPGRLRHRAGYKFPLSDEWQAWIGGNKRVMSQGDFAAFIEDRILDVLPADAMLSTGKIAELVAKLGGLPASPSMLMEYSRGLKLTVKANVRNETSLATGEVVFVFEEEHQNGSGERVSVPNCFLIGVPIFVNGAPYQLLARLRYRKKDASILWFYELSLVEKTIDHAIAEAANLIANETGLPKFYGKPEATPALPTI